MICRRLSVTGKTDQRIHCIVGRMIVQDDHFKIGVILQRGARIRRLRYCVLHFGPGPAPRHAACAWFSGYWSKRRTVRLLTSTVINPNSKK